jgi:hypothetical protein
MVESLFRGRVTSDRRADDRIGIFQPAHIAVLSPQAGDALTRAAERDITEGPVFREVDRHGNVGAGRIGTDAISRRVRRLAPRAGVPNGRLREPRHGISPAGGKSSGRAFGRS